MWADNQTSGQYVGHKRIERPGAGTIALEYQALSVDSAAALSMIVFTPVTEADVQAITLLIANHANRVNPASPASPANPARMA